MSTETEELIPRADVDHRSTVVVAASHRVAPAPATDAETLILPDGALQVLTLAQRTADDHIAAANQQAHRMRVEATALAQQIHGEARAYADRSRAEADRLLTEARAEAERIVADGTAFAEQLRFRAQQRYEDAVGGLTAKREALQKQIETLAAFDNDHRQQITALLQSQLRVLWGEQPASAAPSESGDEGSPGKAGPPQQI